MRQQIMRNKMSDSCTILSFEPKTKRFYMSDNYSATPKHPTFTQSFQHNTERPIIYLQKKDPQKAEAL